MPHRMDKDRMDEDEVKGCPRAVVGMCGPRRAPWDVRIMEA